MARRPWPDKMVNGLLKKFRIGFLPLYRRLP
jgi:hypothetical protein